MELMITVLLHGTGGEPWTDEELSPIREIKVYDVMPSYSPLGAVLTLADGTEYTVDFADIDGNRTC